ncbi:MAG: nuclear transport factor 2 family protein [Gemmatimonadaceae bacterium]
MTTRVGAVIVAMLAFGTHLAAQRPTAGVAADPGSASSPSDLRSAIAAADSSLFAAFNQRDLIRLRSFFTRDLEFYQDNEGVENYAQTVRDFGQMFRQPASIRRELVPGSLEVYPIKNYGAMEVGRHRFCHVENGSDNCGTFAFVHIWRKTKAGWKIARVVSYGH